MTLDVAQIIPLAAHSAEPGPCPVCQRPMPLRATFEEMTVTSQPWRLVYRDAVIAGFKPLACKIIYTLIGAKASRSDLALLLSTRAKDMRGVTVEVSRINRRFRDNNIPIRIENVAPPARPGQFGRSPAVYRIMTLKVAAQSAADRQAVRARIAELRHQLAYEERPSL